jgi:hypothetical protein
MTDSVDDAIHKSAQYEYYIECLQNSIDYHAKYKRWITSTGMIIPFNKLTITHKKRIIKWCDNNGLISPDFGEG